MSTPPFLYGKPFLSPPFRARMVTWLAKNFPRLLLLNSHTHLYTILSFFSKKLLVIMLLPLNVGF